MAKGKNKELVARILQKKNKTRVALRRSACGAILIDGLVFCFSCESDGAPSSKGLVFTISGEAVADGRVKVDFIDVTYPSGSSTKSIRRQAEYYERKDGGHIYRAAFPEIKIPQSVDEDLFGGIISEENMASGMNRQIYFRFTPKFKDGDTPELMINVYPVENPLDGSCTEWRKITSDRDYFEHGGRELFKKKRK